MKKIIDLGKNYNDRVLQLSWYNQGTPEKDQIQEQVN